MHSKNKSTTVTFRIDSDFEKTLRSEAVEAGLSMNAYVIRTLRESLEWNRFFRQFPLMTVERDSLVALLATIDEKEIRCIANEISVPWLRETASVMYGSADLEALKQVSRLFTKYGYSWSVGATKLREPRGLLMTVNHGICLKWSIYLGEIAKGYLEKCDLQVQYEASEHFVKIIFPQAI